MIRVLAILLFLPCVLMSSQLTATSSFIGSVSGLNVTLIAGTLISEGDSITGPEFIGGSYSQLAYQELPSPVPYFTNKAVSNSRFAQLTNRASAVDGFYTNGHNNVLSVLIGANDLDGMVLPNVTNYFVNLKGYFSQRKAIGFKTVICTVLPRTNATFSLPRSTLNTLIRSDSSWYDSICDFAADAVMGPDSAASDTNLYSDGLHPTHNGQELLKDIYKGIVVNLVTITNVW